MSQQNFFILSYKKCGMMAQIVNLSHVSIFLFIFWSSSLVVREIHLKDE